MFESLFKRRSEPARDGSVFRQRADTSQRENARKTERVQTEALEKMRPRLDSLYEELVKPFLEAKASRGIANPHIVIKANYHFIETSFRLDFDEYLEFWAFGQLLPRYLKGKGYDCRVLKDQCRIYDRIEYEFQVS